MAGFKETPRQKMIGMMYLVLTALLALNVSNEILDAFVIVDESIVDTYDNFSTKVEGLQNDFAAQYSQDQEKVKPYYDKSLVSQKLSKELILFIDSVKFTIVAETEGITIDSAMNLPLENIKAKDNYDVSTTILIGGESFKNGLGYELKDRIEKYKAEMLLLVPEKDRLHFKMGLNVDGEYRDASNLKQDWVQHNFYHTILAANVTILNKIKNDIRNTEYDITNHLYQGITLKDFKFTTISAKILPKSVFLFPGDDFEAEIIIAAVDEKSKPVVDYVMGATHWDDNLINSAVNIKGDSGIVRLKIPTGNKQPREYSFAGRIGIPKPNSSEIEYKYFSSGFILAEPSANVAATKMNVFYRGVDNPINISAAGIPESKLDYSITYGFIKNTKDGLVVQGLKDKKVQEVTVNVYSKSGEKKSLGKQLFRVKDLPDPIVKVRGMKKGERISKQAFLANPYLLSTLPEYVNFKFDYKVTSFTMVITKSGDTFEEKSTSGMLTAKMKGIIQNSRKNSMIVFKDIRAQGPIKKRNLGSLVITLI